VPETPETSPDGQAVKVTVNLTDRSNRAMAEAMASTGETKTEVINRAVQIYAYLQGVWGAEGDVLVRDAPGAELLRLRVF
jgi:hypothetical protein